MLDLTEAGKRDPLLAGLPDRIAVLLGHKEACDATPAGATLLMTGASSICEVMAFPKTQTAACPLTQAPSSVAGHFQVPKVL